MDAWHRAIVFMRRTDERAAEQVVPFRWGRALIDRRFGLVHDANYLIADQLADGEVDADALIAEAERLQGDVGLAHRRVNVDDEAAAIRLAPAFVARRFHPERFVLMVRQRRPAELIDHGFVREVDWERMRPARELQRSRQPWATPARVQQMLARHALIASRIETRYFAALHDGRVASSCEVRTDGDAAQVEIVETLEEFRNRGLARAVIGAALEAAKDRDFVFLVTDAEDWPQQLYQRLGFGPVGIETRFLRVLDS
jgi:ribosomal protein S18 acetylase RimI-like enzyme